MSYGDSAAELIKELSRSNDNVPRYDDIGVREVIEETNNLVTKNNEAIHSAEIQNLLNGQANGALDETFSEAELSVWANYNIKTCAIERNKRCLIAYHMKRLKKIKQLRWELGPVIPSHIRQGLSTRERSFSNEYNKVLSRLMRAHGGIDITQNLTPPKSLYAEVICQEDAGDLDLESGERIVLEKNMRYFLPRSAIEHLVRQGLLQEV